MDDVDLVCMQCGAYVDDVALMCMLCGSYGSTMWSFHRSTSTHLTNRHSLSPVLFLTD